MPFAFPISSATDLTPLPATNAVIVPPSFVPAVTAANDAGWNFPSFCSRTASVEANRAKAKYCGTPVACDRRSCDRAFRKTEARAVGSMVAGIGERAADRKRRSWVSSEREYSVNIYPRTAERDDLRTSACPEWLSGASPCSLVGHVIGSPTLRLLRLAFVSIAKLRRDTDPSHHPHPHTLLLSPPLKLLGAS
jgi:hypothetical protein